MTFFIVLVAFCIRLPLLSGSFWLDEAAQALESSRTLNEQLHIFQDFQPPLYHLWVHLFTYGGSSEWWLRLSSLIPALITIYLLTKIANKWAGLLLATSQFYVFYSQELRPYSLSSMLFVLALFLVPKINQTKSLLALIAVNAMGLLTVYTYPLAIIGQLSVVVVSKKVVVKKFLISCLLSLIVVSWWLPAFRTQLANGQTLRLTLPGWDQIVSPPMAKMIPLTASHYIIGRIPVPNSPVLMGIFMLPLLLFGYYFYKSLFTTTKPYTIASIVILIVAFFISFLIPILDAKRVLFMLPLLYASLALSAKKKIILFFISLNLVSCTYYWLTPIVQREPWRQAVTHIQNAVPEKTVFLFAFTAPFAPFEWYAAKPYQSISLGFLGTKALDDLDPVLLPLLTQQSVVAFDYLMDVTDPQRITYSWLKEAGFVEASFYQYPGIGKIRHFVKATSVAYKGLQ